MEAKELRIGNYIDLGGQRNFHIVDELHEITSLNINPIPLTEEWLLKFGWVYNEEISMFEKIGFPQCFLRITTFGYEMSNYILKSITTRNIKSVHQLQNLYFALTGEELSCN